MTHRFRGQRKRNENDVVKACLAWLRLNRFYAIRINAGAFRTERGGFYRMAIPGISDILAVKYGKLFCVECKMPGRVQSPVQKQFEQDITRAGAVYMVVHDTQELEEKLK